MKDIIYSLLRNGPGINYTRNPKAPFPIEFVTENIQIHLGYSPKTLTNDPQFWSQIIHPDDKPFSIQDFDLLPDAGRRVAEYRVETADEDYRWLRDENWPLYDDVGDLISIAGCWIDITEYKTRELELDKSFRELKEKANKQTKDLRNALEHLTATQSDLKDSELKHRTLFEASHDAVILLDKQGFLDCNPAALKLFACESRVQFLQLSPVDFSPDYQPIGLPSSELVVQFLNKAFIEGGLRFEWDTLRMDGSRFDCEVQLSAMMLKGKPVLLAICRDISERKQAEQERELLHRQLRRAHRMDAIGRLTGGIAHDFNNLLAAILGFSTMASELLSREILNKIKIQSYIDEVVAAGERAKRLVKQLLAFTRGETIELETLVPDEIINDSVQMLRATIPTSVYLTIETNGKNHVIKTNPVQLQQAIVNLIINARDALKDEKGSIDVSITNITIAKKQCASCYQEFSGNFVEIQVADDGRGIQTEDLSRIFEPFFTTKDVGKGSGLGLSVVHGIMHSCNGHIDVYSTPGNGTTFSLYFPSITENANEYTMESNSSADSEKNQTSKNTRIMVIDDERSITYMLTELLQTVNYRVVSFNDPLNALEYFKQDPQSIDIVITDQTMPHLTGMELAEELLAIKSNINIILMTGYSTVTNNVSATQKGIKQLIAKPIDGHLLLKLLTELTNH